MEDLAQLHLASPPSSLTDGLLAPRVSTPPVPRPRKSSSLSLSSTPKHPPTARHLPATPHTNGHEHHHTETEEDSSPSSHRRSSSRHNGPHHHHGKHHKKTQQHSYSLPATPRVNGSSQQSSLNGNFPLGSSPSYSAIPYLLAPHSLDQTSSENVLSNNSHYITCQTGVSHLENSVFLGQQKCKLTGAIDYSSLPLPREDHEPVRRSQDMSRHMSEPCITQAQRCSASLTYSPKKKVTKHRSRLSVSGKESGFMDNIKESGQSEGESEEINALEVQWRFIQTLVAELNATKANNRKLMAELHQAKMEIQVLKASLDSYTESGLQPGAIAERDAALTHSRTMMDRLSLSPRGSGGPPSNVDAAEQDLPSGGNSSCTSSPRRSERRHRRSSDYSPTSASAGAAYTSAPPAYTQCMAGQGLEQRSLGDREAATLAQLATLEDELRTLRLATTIHHTLHEGGEGSAAGNAPGVTRISAEYMEGLCTQLRESEASRWQLHDQCTRLERLVNVLRKKVNGLSVVEPGVRQEGTKLTLVDLTLHGPPGEVSLNSGQRNPAVSTSSEGEPKDSLSSLESVETASASSWRRGELPNTSNHSATNLHSSYVLHHSPSPLSTLSINHGGHGNLIHSTTTPANPSQSIPIHSNHSSLSTSSGHTPNASPHHHRQQGVSERDPRHIPGVTIVGPITEL
ncbi:hypothetical protein Hamer_G016986 [Homarus americanus]|uniref:Uncharacterized protein n=1 Tax=Homarus americanus TaxID=6706 RepID=A0A8J5NAH5_HOMAM|nr:hypothetical protein Hamer_G016986 [Homarus americanus]